ncbi:hypothetical protein PsexTeo8_21160 [Pseudomonas extremaustralis]|uniref:hypothetical protein n=1 Tax=Pseudomonas extremaustralis TaxID=359110 RepID=UPI002AA0C3F4|nr:hypothetical protein [Pseudomonas extremaustralis]MDY7065671.1 hypothetical protein [Pseudomonas extremaustralis]
MKSAAPDKTTKAVRRPRCKQCRKQFRTTSAVKVFCTPVCQALATKLKRRINRVERATNSAFLYHLAYEVERAGTLQILTGHTVESLVDLHAVYLLKLKANQYGQTRDFEISHICPSRGHDSLGLYHAQNLVVAPAFLNRAHGTKHYGGGLSISRSALVSKHAVEKGAPRKQTVERIIAFLGADVVAELVKVAKIQTTRRHALMSWLHDHLDTIDPEQRRYFDQLDSMTPQALAALKAKLEGKEGGAFQVKTTAYTPLAILFLELQRHAQHRPELTEVIEAICTVVNRFSVEYIRRSILNEAELQAVFDVLHGKPLESIPLVLAEFTERHTSIMDHGERIPAYKPIVFNVVSQPRPAAKSAVVVHKVFRSFAAELDSSTDDMPPPVLQAHTVTYEADPLPWD